MLSGAVRLSPHQAVVRESGCKALVPQCEGETFLRQPWKPIAGSFWCPGLCKRSRTDSLDALKLWLFFSALSRRECTDGVPGVPASPGRAWAALYGVQR